MIEQDELEKEIKRIIAYLKIDVTLNDLIKK